MSQFDSTHLTIAEESKMLSNNALSFASAIQLKVNTPRLYIALKLLIKIYKLKIQFHLCNSVLYQELYIMSRSTHVHIDILKIHCINIL